jgi:hypothetical protein
MRITSLTQGFWFRAKLSRLCTMGLPWMAASLTGAPALSAIVLSVPARAAFLSSWEYNPSNYELEILVPGGTTPRYSLVAEPARIIIDLPNTTVGTVSQQQTYGGAIREIRVAQHEPGVTRIVLELAPGTVLAPEHVELRQVGTSGSGGTSDRWVLRPLLVTDSPTQTAAAPTPTPTSPPPQSASSSDRQPPASTTADATPDSLPPLEPGALEIPVELPPAEPIAQAQPIPPLSEPENASNIESSIEPNTEPNIEPDIDTSESEVESEPETAAVETQENAQENSPSEADRTYGANLQPAEEMPGEVITVPEPTEITETAEVAEPIEPESASELEVEISEAETEIETSEEPIAEAAEPGDASANVVVVPDLAIEAVVPDQPSLDDAPDADPVAPTLEATEPEVSESEIAEPEVSEPSLSIAQQELQQEIQRAIQSIPQTDTPSQPIVQPEEGLPALPPADSSANTSAMVSVPSLEEEVTTEELPNSPNEDLSNEEDLTENLTNEEDLTSEEPITAAEPTPETPSTPASPDSSTADIPLPNAVVNRLVDEAPVGENTAVGESTAAGENAVNPDRPTLQSTPDAPASPAIATVPSPATNRLIEFGQPLTAANAAPSNPVPPVPAVRTLPPASPLQPNATIVPGNVLLPAGSILRLRYPGTVPLALVEGQSRQEVMVLAASVQDAAGNVILPEGSHVIGRFETQAGRSQFVTQAIALQGRNVLLNAESENLLGESTSSDDRRLQNSAIGGTADAVVGGMTGISMVPAIAAGGAAGAATAAVSAPSSAVIQPDQVFDVQLTEDLPQIN